MRSYLCTWCGGEFPRSAEHACGRPPGFKASAAWPPDPTRRAEVCRALVLTEQGWRQAGYVWTADRGYVKRATTP